MRSVSGVPGSRLVRGLYRRAGMRVFRFFARQLERQRVASSGALALRWLREAEVLGVCGDAELSLTRDGVAAAFARGDLCCAALDADRIAGYCWVAFAPLPHLDGVWVRFDRSAAWIYKSFVRPSGRGRGIAPALYRFVEPECRERGRERALICVESFNHPSVRAALSAGYAPSGYGMYWRGAPRFTTWCSPAARAHDVSFFRPA